MTAWLFALPAVALALAGTHCWCVGRAGVPCACS